MKRSLYTKLTIALAGAMLASAASAVTSGPGEATLTVDNNWGEGYCANVTIANNGGADITSWAVDLDFNGSVANNVWSGMLSGTIVTPEAYNSTVAPGSSTSFGFCANGSNVAELAALSVNGGGDVDPGPDPDPGPGPDPDPGNGEGEHSITVRMSGFVGDESVSLTVGGETLQTWTLSVGMLDYSVNTDVTGELRVAFTNDEGDRDVQVDYVIVNGVTYQAEDQADNTGAWDGECGAGSYTEMLHCNGSIGFGNPFDGSPDPDPGPGPGPGPGPNPTPPELPDFFIGNITTNYEVRSDFIQYWDQITPENEGKWGSVEGTRDNYNWGPLDAIDDYARAHDIPVKGHTLVWGSQQPNWIDGLSPAEQRAEIEEWMHDYCERYPDTAMMDVVNEALDSHAPANYARSAFGNDWITESFRLARQYCPDTILIYNDFNFVTWDTDAIMDLIGPAVASGYVDAIGVQAHGLYSPRVWSAQEIQSKLDQISTLGLPIYVSEYDIAETNDQTQLEYMQMHFPVFYNHPNVVGITFWGYIVGATWVDGTGLMHSNGQQRPAMQWLLEYVNR